LFWYILLLLSFKFDNQTAWKLYLFIEHQYQPVSSFPLTVAILVYPYLKHCLCTLHK